jgi:hypothetical protein
MPIRVVVKELMCQQRVPLLRDKFGIAVLPKFKYGG